MMSHFSKNIALWIFGFWLGCTLLFATVVAPTLFNPDVTSGLSHSMAGSIVGAILRRIYLITYITMGLACFFLIITSLQEGKGSRGPRRALFFCLLILGLNALNDQWILKQVNEIKLAMVNSSDQLIPELQKKFDFWHKISTWVYGVAILCGFVGTFFLMPSSSPTSGKQKKSSR